MKSKSLIYSILFTIFIVTNLAASELSKSEWMNKVSKKLRLGQMLSHNDPIDKWLQMDEKSIIFELMKDPQFAFTILDFNLYFLGNRPSRIINKKIFSPLHYIDFDQQIFQNPRAIRSAIEGFNGKNYLTLFDYERGWYTNRIREAKKKINGGQFEKIPLKDSQKYRINLKSQVLSSLIKARDKYLESNDSTFLCHEIRKIRKNNYYLNELGFDPNIVSFELSRFHGPFCQVTWSKKKLLKFYKFVEKRFTSLVDLSLSLFVDQYELKTLNQLKVIPKNLYTNIAPYLKLRPFTRKFFLKLDNPSTNMNRKRAAYILRQYFCDDLTPIKIEISSEPSKGEHGSDSQCISCHYKLDPMAGFFKNYGKFGFDYSGLKTIIFDDDGKMEREDYVKAWHNPVSNHQRKWNIGFIQTTNPKYSDEKNYYGENIEDLFKIIKNSDKVKSCLVKRATEYFVGKEQVFSGYYLTKLQKNFEENIKKKNSSYAFKRLVSDILLSNTFKQADPKKDKCYEKMDEHNILPCKIEYIIDKRCSSCHDSSAVFEKEYGYLNFETWLENSKGQGMFEHRDKNGKLLSKDKSFELIKERLNTPNLEIRMPLNRFMPPIERAELYKWLERQVKQ